MEIAKILVNQTTGHCMVRRRIPAGLVGGTVSVEFDDPIWDRLVKTVVFRGTEVKAAEFDGKTAVIPWEVLEHPGPYLFFGIWGSDPDSALQLPLIEVRIGPIEDATDPTADPGTDPTLPIWAQLQQDLEELKKNGVGGESNVFIARYGETSNEEIFEAFRAGKLCFVRQGYTVFPSTTIMSSRAIFGGSFNGSLAVIDCFNGVWTRTNIERSEEITEESTHLQFPTAKAVVDYVKVHGGDVAQSDWNAAEGQPGHILNRPFYTEQQEVTILEETTLEANGSFGGFDGVACLPNLLDLTDGQTCTVTYNGTVHPCKAQETTFQGLPCFIMGNAAAYGGEDTGEPFALATFTEESAETAGIFGGIIPMDGSKTFTVSITGLVDVVHPIPAKYLENARGQKEIRLDLDAGTASIDIAETEAMDAAVLQNSLIVVYDGAEHSAVILDTLHAELEGIRFHNIVFMIYHETDTYLPAVLKCAWRNDGVSLGSVYTLAAPVDKESRNFLVYGKLRLDSGPTWRELSDVALSGVLLQSTTQNSAKSLLLTMDDDGVLYYQIKAGGDLSERVPVNKVTDEHINELIDEKLDSGGNVDLGVTGATVGQTVKISAVDENGVPTAWEPVDFPSGGYEVLLDTTLTEEANYVEVPFGEERLYKELYFMISITGTANVINKNMGYYLLLTEFKSWTAGIWLNCFPNDTEGETNYYIGRVILTDDIVYIYDFGQNHTGFNGFYKQGANMTSSNTVTQYQRAYPISSITTDDGTRSVKALCIRNWNSAQQPMGVGSTIKILGVRG